MTIHNGGRVTDPSLRRYKLHATFDCQIYCVRFEMKQLAFNDILRDGIRVGVTGAFKDGGGRQFSTDTQVIVRAISIIELDKPVIFILQLEALEAESIQ